MCYNTKLTRKAAEIEKRFKADLVVQNELQLSEQISGFNFPKTPVITKDFPNSIHFYNWGLIPSFSQNNEIRQYTLNAKIETLSKKRSFEEYIENRCLVIVNGFYEWKWHDTKGRNKEKFLIGLKNETLFALAGIYASWKNPVTDELVNSYSIVTTEANELMSEIHNIKKRMPVILTPENETQWLDGSELSNFTKVEANLIAESKDSQMKLF